MEAVGRSDFGTLLREYRLDAGITQQELAERAKLSVEAISTLERGARRRPHRDTVVLLADALRLSPEQRAALLGSIAGLVHQTRRRERSEALNESLLRVVRPETQARPTDNLPHQLTSFVGRRRELDEITALVREHRLVTIVGSGGVGKSRVAVQLGGEPKDEWPDGIWLVELAPLGDATLVASTVLGALQVPLGTSGPPLDAVVAHLKARRVLLILDNCEHVIAEARNVATAVVESCPHVRVLSTSREALNVPGEWVYRLPSLAVPPDTKRTAQDAQPYGAVALFADRAQAVDGSFTLTDDNAQAVGEICRRLDGIPLAIELAAARVKVLAPGQIAKKLDERFRLLTGGDPRALPRHQTMRALIDWSYDSLTPREQRFFEHLSVFAGGCTLDSATAVCADDDEDDLDVLNLVTSLVTKSLLVSELVGGEQRYLLLESSRQYALEKIAARGEQHLVAQRHAIAYLDLAEQLEASRYSLAEATWAQAEAELDNWRAALEWSLGARNDVETGQRLAGALWFAWQRFSGNEEGLRWVRAGLATIGSATPTRVVAKLELNEARITGEFQQSEASLAAAERALALYRQAHDRFGIATAQSIMGRALMRLGRSVEAEALLVEALATARTLGKPGLAAATLDFLGTMHAMSGDIVSARLLLEESLAIYSSDSRGIIVATMLLAEGEFRAGDAQAALGYSTEALAMSRRHGHKDGVMNLLNNSAAYLVALGRHDEARVLAREVLDASRDFQLPIAILHLAAVAALRPSDDVRAKLDGRARAARLLGFVNAHNLALGASWGRDSYTERNEYERLLAVLGEEFGADELTRLIAAGATMSVEHAIAEARAIV